MVNGMIYLHFVYIPTYKHSRQFPLYDCCKSGDSRSNPITILSYQCIVNNRKVFI